jgi:hypothetical protein
MYYATYPLTTEPRHARYRTLSLFPILVIKNNANQRSGTNRLGDVTYQVKREFWGNIDMVGTSICVTGKTHGNPDANIDGNEYVDEMSLIESELGYFTMIDAVEGERPV